MNTLFDLLKPAPDQSGRPRSRPLEFRAYLAAVEGLLLPDKPSVPGTSRINTSLYPRSRYKAHPTLKPPQPRLPRPKPIF